MATGDGDLEGLYSKLTVTPTATREEIVDSYRKEVRLLEQAAKLSHKGRAFKEADIRFREVSKAFTILSDASYRQQYDDGQVVPDLPTFTRKTLKNPKDYCIKHNEQSITVFLPHTSNLAKTWLETCEEYHDTQAKDGGKNGHQIKFPFVDTQTKETIGSVSIKFYESTQKLLIQGSAYLLWFSGCFSELKVKISSGGASVPTGSARSEDVLIASPDKSPVSLCQTCGQCLTSDLCQACNTTPKSVVDVSVVDENGNETQDGVTDVPDNSLGTQNQTANMAIQTQSSPVDMCIVQDTVNKLEASLASSISDRHAFENSVCQRLNSLENKMKSHVSHVCEGLSTEEKKKLSEDIANLKKVKNDLQKQVDSLQEKLEDLTNIVKKANTPMKSAETQTNSTPSERADKLLREIASVPVRNRFQVLDNEENIHTDTPERRDISYTSANRREEDNKARRTKQQPFVGNMVNSSQQKTMERPDANLQDKEKSVDTLILGDSNTKAIRTDMLYPGKCVKKETTFTITEATEYVQHSAIPDPKVVLFHVGTNDVRDTRDPATVSERFRKAIQTTRDKFPQTEIVLSSIPPRDNPDLQQIGNDVNTFLKVIAEETTYVHFVDNGNLSSMGSIKRSLYSPDGYHINRFGVRVLAANFKRTVNPLLGLGQYMGKSARDSHTSPPYQPTARRQGHQERTVRNGRPPTRHGHESVRNTPLPTHPSVQQGQENGTSDGPGIQGQQSSDAVRETRSPIAPRGRPFHQETQPTAPKPPHPGPPPFPPSSGRPPFLPSPGRPPFLPSPGRPPFLPNQAPGPWGCPPGSFSHPPVPWGTPTTNSSPNTPPRINSSPWTWHPSMFWPPMINMW